MNLSVAVVGGGIFGVTAAIRLSNIPGITVEIFERKSDVLMCATFGNQLRLHRGYHYPRSDRTVDELKRSRSLFDQDYGDALIRNDEHFYVISKNDSRVSGDDYVRFCGGHGLHLEEISLDSLDRDLFNIDEISRVFQVEEELIDFSSLREICRDRLRRSNIVIHLGREFTRDEIGRFDQVINCTYARINGIVDSQTRRDYQFELCEKIVITPCEKLLGKSIVVMDGPFMCVDPYGRTGKSLLGNVVHAIRKTNVGKFFSGSSDFDNLIDSGIVNIREKSAYESFISAGEKFLPCISRSSYVGSMLTVRTVLPDVDDTDCRPTFVRRESDKIISVFSGKIGTCSRAAQEVCEEILRS